MQIVAGMEPAQSWMTVMHAMQRSMQGHPRQEPGKHHVVGNVVGISADSWVGDGNTIVFSLG